MSNDFNPYASPEAIAMPPQFTVAEVIAPDGLWWKGRLLVMSKDAVLPDRCVKSNQPAHGGRLKRSMSWHEPWLLVLIFAGLLIYAILAVLLSKRATIYIGVSEPWLARRRNAMLVGWLLVLAGIASTVAGLLMVDQYPTAGWGIGLGLLLLFFGALWGLLRCRLVSPERISDHFIWLKGVHPDFLAELPTWTRNP